MKPMKKRRQFCQQLAEDRRGSSYYLIERSALLFRKDFFFLLKSQAIRNFVFEISIFQRLSIQMAFIFSLLLSANSSFSFALNTIL